MASTTTIPLTTLPIGSQVFGPHVAQASESSVSLTIDRTVAGGLNSLTLDSVLAVLVELSNDGGTTWHATDTDQMGTQTAWTAVGSPVTYTDKQGVQHVYTVSSATWYLFPGNPRRIRATITVSGPSPIAIAGSITTN